MIQRLTLQIVLWKQSEIATKQMSIHSAENPMTFTRKVSFGSENDLLIGDNLSEVVWIHSMENTPIYSA